jgi:SAM-dependent methyltransferase
MKSGQQFKTYLQMDNKNLFQIFDVPGLNIDWKNVSILDYGCNQGNYINSAHDYIDSTRYLGIDIMELAIDQAKKNHTDYNFIHYDKWHQAYNPSGNKNLTVTDVVLTKFDVIICYSVFTHTTFEQMQLELSNLQNLLNPNGIILFSVWGSKIFEPFYNFISNKFDNITPIDFENINYSKMAYWVDGINVVTDEVNFQPDTYNSFNTFYNLLWLVEAISPAVKASMPIGQYQDLFYLRKL